MEDRDFYVREAAVEALALVAEKGDKDVIVAVSQHLEDTYADVRKAVVEALVFGAEKGDKDATAAVRKQVAVYRQNVEKAERKLHTQRGSWFKKSDGIHAADTELLFAKRNLEAAEQALKSLTDLGSIAAQRGGDGRLT